MLDLKNLTFRFYLKLNVCCYNVRAQK
jgi:hypothetical protein